MDTMKEKVISLLGEVKRNGIENLIQFVKESDYLTSAECHSHHKCYNGLMMHSLEVLDYMLKNLCGLPRESVILVALCHDLGKARVNGKKIGPGSHPSRAVYILEQCGVELTEDERNAIRNHHTKGWGKLFNSAFASPLQMYLHLGDCKSTGLNKSGATYRFSAI